MAIPDTWLKANSGKPRAIREEKADRDGLSVRITPKGKITFQLRFRYDARPCRLDLGTYPLMSLKDARAESQRLRAQLEQGMTPGSLGNWKSRRSSRLTPSSPCSASGTRPTAKATRRAITKSCAPSKSMCSPRLAIFLRIRSPCMNGWFFLKRRPRSGPA